MVAKTDHKVREPRTTGALAPVTAGRLPGLPMSDSCPRTAKAMASRAWSGTPQAAVVVTRMPAGSLCPIMRRSVEFRAPPPATRTAAMGVLSQDELCGKRRQLTRR